METNCDFSSEFYALKCNMVIIYTDDLKNRWCRDKQKYAENKYAINSLKTIRIFDPIKVTEILLLQEAKDFCIFAIKIQKARLKIAEKISFNIASEAFTFWVGKN